MTGVGTLHSFLVNLFEDSGSKLDPYFATVMVGIIKFVLAIFAPMALRFIPRRTMYLVTSFLLFVFLLILGFTPYIQEHFKPEEMASNATQATVSV